MDFLYYILGGIVHGIAEFLAIDSAAHIASLKMVGGGYNQTVCIALSIGSILAAMVFRRSYVMKKLLFLLLFVVSCSNNDNSGDKNQSCADPEKSYLQLIDLLEQGISRGISKKLIDRMSVVYDETLLPGMGPNSLVPFIDCAEAHGDLQQIIRECPAEIIEGFKWRQEWLLGKLRFMKTCNIPDDEHRHTAVSIIDSVYVEFLIALMAAHQDFFDKCIAEAIKKESFSPATAMMLYVKFSKRIEGRLLRTPKVSVLSGNNFPGKILIVEPTGCCRTTHVETFYVDKNGNIDSIGFYGECKKGSFVDVENNFRFFIGGVNEQFYKWDAAKGVLSFYNSCSTESFRFDVKKKQWIRSENIH
ncbi:hypothetical protein FACS189472_15250 [Alphaproteobacteria bacterium]|nr:hypothetical protein FACS189472_15250 [Alphaproteobacteria bacterium]